jgi:hypothetical protein
MSRSDHRLCRTKSNAGRTAAGRKLARPPYAPRAGPSIARRQPEKVGTVVSFLKALKTCCASVMFHFTASPSEAVG